MSEIEKIITTFVNGNKMDATDAIDDYAKANNMGVGDVFREMSFFIFEASGIHPNILLDGIDGFKVYVNITVYYANNNNKGVL